MRWPFRWIRFFEPGDEPFDGSLESVRLNPHDPPRLVEVSFSDGRFYYFDIDGSLNSTGAGDGLVRKYGDLRFPSPFGLKKEEF